MDSGLRFVAQIDLPRLLGGAADAVDAEEDVVRVAQALRPVVAPLLAFQRRRRIPTLEL
jgi:hypothetical protein